MHFFGPMKVCCKGTALSIFIYFQKVKTRRRTSLRMMNWKTRKTRTYRQLGHGECRRSESATKSNQYLMPVLCLSYLPPTSKLNFLTLNAPIATKVVCFCRPLKCLRSLYGKQCGPRSDCSYRSSLFWVHTICFYT